MDDYIKREDAIKAVENVSENYTKEGDREWHPHIDFITQALAEVPSAEKQGVWITKSIETYDLPEGQIVVEYDASGVGLISRECMEMLMDTLATNKPKQGEWILGTNTYYKCSSCQYPFGKKYYNFCPNCGRQIKRGEK